MPEMSHPPPRLALVSSDGPAPAEISGATISFEET
jgi:hypothetical protein